MSLSEELDNQVACAKLLALRESYEFEAKDAQGRDGNGAVPNALWASYSAMANSDGGYILLGAAENSDGSLKFTGIKNAGRVVDDFWNTINNPDAVSRNILHQGSVEVIECDDVNLVLIRVERASRKERPIYIGKNPFGNTYKRLNQGDYRCRRDEVSQMIADAVADARDSDILDDFTIDDIDGDSLRAFRNDFASSKPRHPYLTFDDKDLLEHLGGWRVDRKTQREGLTLAGLLMFGKWKSIREALPHYSIDYQDRTHLVDDQRWSDRVLPDGTWSGNLYDFYRRVYSKLVADLAVPFQMLEGAKRVDETDVHIAIREALINALVHADYSLTTGILIVKHPSGFIFRNPGVSRVPIDLVYQGGVSDCRNPSLQLMFQMVGGAEKAGSGFPKIRHAWERQHWRRPALSEKPSPEVVELELFTVGLYPEWVTSRLITLFGDRFKQLSPQERSILATAVYERRVSNQRLQLLLDLHPTDVTRLLSNLVDLGMLVRQRISRWYEYEVAQGDMARADPYQSQQQTLFPLLLGDEDVAASKPTGTRKPSKGSQGRKDSQGLARSQGRKDSQGHLASQRHATIEEVPRRIVAGFSTVTRKPIPTTILELCLEPKSTAELASILDLDPTYLRQRYTSRLIKTNHLEYTAAATSPDVQYRTTELGRQMLGLVED
ncbi:hypothetical protein DEIPH_ctg013orf0002 [Deinococcus phoenicis]|uniref:Schlafen AlbA-2 domain-containing protein n=1 Tax=Deinococcus phoenicis TaxID=1476583 RepID=A0A016QRY0_9DEIO|nr:RNA-binding domain-containing protein [Deinococcus phoenicis]EYB68900.1 hypothetical protein DEIPH_ctg013orf0002 [Deinococcus phoenicis]